MCVSDLTPAVGALAAGRLSSDALQSIVVELAHHSAGCPEDKFGVGAAMPSCPLLPFPNMHNPPTPAAYLPHLTYTSCIPHLSQTLLFRKIA